MANVLEAKARPGTNTVKRPWPNNTETPEPHQDRGQDNPPPPDDLVQLESGSYVYTINWDRKVQFTVPASDDQDNAIQKTHGANLSSRLQRVLPFVTSYTPLAGSNLDEVIKRLLSSDPLAAAQHVRHSASIPEDTLGWTSDELSDAILASKGTRDWSQIRGIIIAAEDTGFTPAQSDALAPRLIELAVAYRDSDDPRDKPVVWSAIRTGASMLRLDQAHRLRALLEPGHRIETSLVAVKMLGRIFEAQPPADVDQYPELAADVRQIAELLLNPYAMASSQSAAMAQLAVYALAAMASSDTPRIAKTARELGQRWFSQQTSRGLRELRNYWTNAPSAVAPAPLDVLERAIRELAVD